MSRFKYTTLHDMRDHCMIYDGSWPIKYWNFTDNRCEHLSFMYFEHDKINNHRVAVFETTDSPQSQVYDNIDGWRTALRGLNDINRDDSDERYEYAEIRIINSRNGQPMHITFTGSTNRPVENREMNFSINYVDEDFHKWHREWHWFKIKCRYRLEVLETKIKKLFKK